MSSNLASSQKVRVLVVDDFPANLSAMSGLLSRIEGVEVQTCQSGKEALWMLLQEEYAIALLDVFMPDMNGFELASIIRSREATRHLPLIFTTAAHESSDILFEGYEHGAVDVLFKPLQPAIVRCKVEAFIQLFLSRRLVEERNQQLELARVEAEQANRLKDRFLANVSHEIRTPLQAILGMAELLEEEDQSSAEQKKMRQAIRQSASYLSSLINDILDLSKIQSGTFHVRCDDTMDLAEIGEAVLAIFVKQASSKNLKLNVEMRSDCRTKFVSNSVRLKQIVLNLVGNAVKFTSKGGVTLGMELTDTRAGWQLTIEVADTGPGILPEEQAAIFSPFSQVGHEISSALANSGQNPTHGTTSSGVGLGLSLSQLLAQALGGQIVVKSSPPRPGSTFTLILPIEIETQPDASSSPSVQGRLQSFLGEQQSRASQNSIGPEIASSLANDVSEFSSQVDHKESEDLSSDVNAAVQRRLASAKPLADFKILLAEDSEHIALFVDKVLTSAGAQVQWVKDGLTALSLLSSPDAFFHLVLLDLQIPGCDGLTVAQNLRDQKLHRPLVAFTASQSPENLKMLRAAGFRGVVHKPVERMALVSHILHYSLGAGDFVPNSRQLLHSEIGPRK